MAAHRDPTSRDASRDMSLMWGKRVMGRSSMSLGGRLGGEDVGNFGFDLSLSGLGFCLFGTEELESFLEGRVDG